MNAKFLLAIIATTTLLTACGGGHEHVKAVDQLAQAEAAAKEKAPKAESITFADAGQPTLGGVGGTKDANVNNPADSADHVANDIAVANAQTVAHHGQADTATDEKSAQTNPTSTDKTTTQTPEQPTEQTTTETKTN